MEIMTSPFYVSAPTSPEKHLLDALRLYSHQPDTDPPTPTEEAESNLDGFEFETSRRFCYEPRDGEGGGGGEEVMAFADELFCDWKVRPLEPPPKLGIDKRSESGRSSPRMRRGGSFLWRSLWNDDFDPFEAALVNVRKEGYRRGRLAGECPKRRARSLSPFRRRSSLLNEPSSARTLSLLDREREKPLGSGQPGPKENAVLSPKEVARPRGVEFARRVRLVRGQCSMKNEREPKTKKLLPKKSKPMTRRSNSVKKEKAEVSARADEKRGLSKMVKMAIVHHRPNFFLCLGHGIKALGKL